MVLAILTILTRGPIGLLIHKGQIIPIWIFAILGRYLHFQLLFKKFENLYESVNSLELCGKLIFTKRRLMV